MSVLPPELQDLVIAHLRDDRPTLASAALVSKSWLHFSRPIFFESVTLSENSWERFLQLLDSQHTTVLKCITSLSISCAELVKDKTHAFFTGLLPRLPMLPSLTALQIWHVSWSNVLAVESDVFVSRFARITELQINRALFESPSHFIGVLARLPRLEKVAAQINFVRDTAPAPAGPAPQTLREVRLRLRLAETDVFSVILGWLHADDTPPPIRTLELGMLPRLSLPAVGNLIRAIGPALTTLDLRFFPEVRSADIEAQLDLTHSSIAHLTLHIGLRRFHAPCTTPAVQRFAPWALLAALPATTASRLRKLSIVLAIESIYMLHSLDWAHLDNALAAHPGVERLQFVVNSQTIGREVTEGIRARVGTAFAQRGGVVEAKLVRMLWSFSPAGWRGLRSMTVS